MASLRTLGKPNRLRDLFQAVAQAPDVRNAHAVEFHFLAQSMHVNFDCIVADRLAPLPAQMADQTLFREYAAGTLQEHFEQAKFACRQAKRPIANAGSLNIAGRACAFEQFILVIRELPRMRQEALSGTVIE